jgi:hypothetical protein
MDCHEHWHAAADSYMEPDGFRLNLNALIQNLRNVTWLLQKQRRDLPDFEVWYDLWKNSIHDDAVMKWLVRSRNRIVKEADLELLSTAKVRLSLDWLNEYESSWVMPPRLNTRSILIRIMSGGGIPPEGLLTIERRWIDKFLPEWELLDAAAYAYNHLVRVVTTAHTKMGIAECTLLPRTRECVTASLASGTVGCMSHRVESRILHIDLSTQTEITEGYHFLEAGKDERMRARERYGSVPMSGTAVELVPSALEIAKRMLSADKELVPVAWIIRDKTVVGFSPLHFPNHDAKRLTMHRLADRLEVMDADGVIVVGEWWSAEIDAEEYLRTNAPHAEELPNRREAIQVIALMRDGQTADRGLFFEHGPNDEIVFGELDADTGGMLNFLEPIRRKWNL